MKKKKTPSDQILNLLERVREYVQRDKWSFSQHAFQRKMERDIDVLDVSYVLTHGYHESRKTKYNEARNSGNYAIRGVTLDGVDIRVIVTFIPLECLVVTVMKVTRLGKEDEK